MVQDIKPIIFVRNYIPTLDRASLHFANSDSTIWDTTYFATQQGKCQMLVGVIGDKVIARVWINYHKIPKIGAIYALDVHPNWRNNGIGTFLVYHCEKLIFEKGILTAQIEAYQNEQRTQKLYMRLGYKKTGTGLDTWEEQGKDNKLVIHSDPTVIFQKKLF